MSDGERPFFPAPTKKGEVYRQAERVTPAEPAAPPPRRVEVTRAEPPASRKRPRPRADAGGLSVEQRLARDHALGNAQANEWAKRAGISIAIRLLGVAIVFALAGLYLILPRAIGTFVVGGGGLVAAVVLTVWRVKLFLRKLRDREGNW